MINDAWQWLYRAGKGAKNWSQFCIGGANLEQIFLFKFHLLELTQRKFFQIYFFDSPNSNKSRCSDAYLPNPLGIPEGVQLTARRISGPGFR